MKYLKLKSEVKYSVHIFAVPKISYWSSFIDRKGEKCKCPLCETTDSRILPKYTEKDTKSQEKPKHKCYCSKRDLLIAGCQCGGI